MKFVIYTGHIFQIRYSGTRGWLSPLEDRRYVSELQMMDLVLFYFPLFYLILFHFSFVFFIYLDIDEEKDM